VKASNVRGNAKEYRAEILLDGNRSTYWATEDAAKTADVVMEFKQPVEFNVVRLREAIRLGERVDAFAVDVWKDGAWVEAARGTSIGACRLVRLGQMVSSPRVRVRVIEASACPALSEAGVFADRG
jgi:alpha-L-fucosidase